MCTTNVYDLNVVFFLHQIPADSELFTHTPGNCFCIELDRTGSWHTLPGIFFQFYTEICTIIGIKMKRDISVISGALGLIIASHSTSLPHWQQGHPSEQLIANCWNRNEQLGLWCNSLIKWIYTVIWILMSTECGTSFTAEGFPNFLTCVCFMVENPNL